MNAISKIGVQEWGIEPHRQPSAELSLARTSSTESLSSKEWDALAMLMAETQARYPNQELPPATPAMWLSEWAEMVQRYTLKGFRAGLLKAIKSSRFFPPPDEIRAFCQADARENRELAEAQRYMREMAATKAQCDRERLEDEAKGPRDRTETEKRLDAILQAARVKDRQEAPYFGPPPVTMTPEEIREAVANGR